MNNYFKTEEIDKAEYLFEYMQRRQPNNQFTEKLKNLNWGAFGIHGVIDEIVEIFDEIEPEIQSSFKNAYRQRKNKKSYRRGNKTIEVSQYTAHLLEGLQSKFDEMKIDTELKITKRKKEEIMLEAALCSVSKTDIKAFVASSIKLLEERN